MKRRIDKDRFLGENFHLLGHPRKDPRPVHSFQRLFLIHGHVGAVGAEVEIGRRLGSGFLFGDNARRYLRKARAASEIQLTFEAVTLGENIFQLGKAFFADEGRSA